MRVKLNPHGVAIYMSRAEARLLKNILVWSMGRFASNSTISYNFCKKLNPMLTKFNDILNDLPTPEEYLNGCG